MSEVEDLQHAGHQERAPIEGVVELPERVLATYARLWQFETWLRRLVYVELRALAGDSWAAQVGKTEGPKMADKRLTHMPTPEEYPLSYAQLSELARIVDDHWDLFSSFLPPKSIWIAKLEEITQIRHRVAHFRVGHRDDLHRVRQLLRDVDQGFWRFCTSYNDARPVLPPSDDPVVDHFLHLDPFPYGPTSDGAWARYGIADPEARLGVTVEVLRRPWATWSTPVAGKEGLLYDVAISARRSQVFDYHRLLLSTVHLHEHVVHLCLDDFSAVLRVTIPAVLGPDEVTKMVEGILSASPYCLHPSSPHDRDSGTAQRTADAWPEYVLGPENPLTFLSPDMPCSFFGV